MKSINLPFGMLATENLDRHQVRHVNIFINGKWKCGTPKRNKIMLSDEKWAERWRHIHKN